VNDSQNYLFENDDELPPPRHSPRFAVIMGAIVLVLLVILASVAAIHTFGNVGIAPTPTPTLTAGSNLFYLATSPSWGSLTVDGHPVRIPAPGDMSNGNQPVPPISLSPGSHQVIWHADPFSPQHCTIFVPTQANITSCLANEKVPVPNHSALTAFVITFTATPAMLPTNQRTAVLQAAQALLNTMQSTATVQPGEHYVDLQAPGFTANATQPLHATLRLQLDTNPNSNATCVGNFIGQSPTCEIQGQNCHQLCMQAEPQLVSSADSWDVLAVMHPTWEYTTLSGQVVASNQPDAADNTGTEYVVLLFISWHGSSWHVAINQKLLDPACAAASGSIEQNANLTTEESDPSVSVDWKFTVGPNRADGCLATASKVGNAIPIAYGLHRFGIFYAVGTLAHRYWPSLPVVDSYEQGIARQLEAQST
jgi:hypothetical protein